MAPTEDDLARFRMDFIQEVISVDEASHKITYKLTPNPKRYDRREVNGEECLYDKLDDVLIPLRVVADALKNAPGSPIYFQPQEIRDARSYVESRRGQIETKLAGQFELPTFEDKSEDFLQSLAADRLGFVIMSVDLVGSTKLATSIASGEYARIIATLLFELAEVVPKFHGHVLKYTGDGILSYFPEPSFITKNDLAIDCALTLRRLVYEAFNPALKRRGLPELGVRIGLDSGEAYVETIGSPATKQHKDIIGAVVSLAAKIQAEASPGEVYLGDVTLRNLHTDWRLRCESVDPSPTWTYRNGAGEPYQLHRVRS